ncbi:hypothetical protein GYMLUDRAFT_37793 [Collybiopsis luxurians FD-317 M1]|nr:hypothetical protein GYMLUDRAFT_37793 [Collybiopsis luxurians FD-317 M1]
MSLLTLFSAQKITVNVGLISSSVVTFVIYSTPIFTEQSRMSSWLPYRLSNVATIIPGTTRRGKSNGRAFYRVIV